MFIHLLIVFSSVVLPKVFISASESQYVTTVIYCACWKSIWNIVFQLWSTNCYMLFDRLWFINTFCLLYLLNVTESLTKCLCLRSKYFKVQFRNKDMVKVKDFNRLKSSLNIWGVSRGGGMSTPPDITEYGNWGRIKVAALQHIGCQLPYGRPAHPNKN